MGVGERQNWEYETHRIPDMVLMNSEAMKERLNAWGAQGYELVNVIYNHYGTFMFFKRPRT